MQNVSLDQYVGREAFKLGMRDRFYKLEPRSFPKAKEQISYENGRLFSAVLEARGENYKKYIRYNKIVPQHRDDLHNILANEVSF